MAGIIILAVLLLLILLVFFVPYGIDVSYADEVLGLKIKAGPFRLKILPKKELTKAQQEKKDRKKAEKDAKKKKKKEEKKKKAAEEQLDETEKIKPKKKPDFETLMALARFGIRAIKRFFRSFSIDYLKLNYIVGSPDPYAAATQYGYICAGLEELPALADKVIRVRKKDISVGFDFTIEKPVIDVQLVLSLRLFLIVHMIFAFAAEFVVWKLKHLKHHKKDSEEPENERKVSYGRKQDQ